MYIRIKGVTQERCKQMKENSKKLRDMNKDGVNSKANAVKRVEDEDDLFLATNDEVAKTKWVIDSATSKHICRDQEMFDTLKTDGEFAYFKLGNGGKMKVEGIRFYCGVYKAFGSLSTMANLCDVVLQRFLLCNL